MPLGTLVNRLHDRVEHYHGVYRKCKQKALEFRKDRIGREAGGELPEELIAKIFDYLREVFIKESAVSNDPSYGHLLALVRGTQVCHQWNSIAEEKIASCFASFMKCEDRPKGMSWARSFGVLYNWQQQVAKTTYLATSQKQQVTFDPIDCQIREICYAYDKIQINDVRVLLGSRALLAVKITENHGKQSLQRLWVELIENPENRIFVSTDQKLIATQHYYYALPSKKGFFRMFCQFDVRYLKTGRLMGEVAVLCPNEEKIFNPTNVQFDFTKFTYQADGMMRTRYYDPCMVNLKNRKEQKI
jgi:F-box-like